MDLHETLYRFYITKKLTHVTVTITKNALRWQQYPGPRYIAIIYTVGYPVAQRVILFGRGQSLAWSEINLQLFCIKIISMSQLNFWSITTGYDVKQFLAIFFRGGAWPLRPHSGGATGLSADFQSRILLIK